VRVNDGPTPLTYHPVAALISDDPYAIYALIAGVLHPPVGHAAAIHSSAVIADSAIISNSARISANVVIGEDCSIAEGVHIAADRVLGKRRSIGRDSQVLANATVGEDVRIGERTIIHPRAVIGSDGFGNARGGSGWIKIPQLGGVVIGSDVEIGTNTAVDRGSIDDTIIEDGVRLDILIQVGHNARRGEALEKRVAELEGKVNKNDG
jgi:UDP-3-O-[3-hydroxymyristoyl] glucosamine N-acyltransferase